MLICIAYGVQYYQVSGPAWLMTDGFDISAKIPTRATSAQYRLMMQDLIAERFQLKLHHESKNATTFTLTVSKGGAKLHSSVASSTNAPGITVMPSRTNSQIHVTATKQTLSNLAGFLSTLNGVIAPVTNATSLAGDFDFVLDYTPPSRMDRNPNGLSLFTALESQVGLKLEARKNPIDILVIDHAEKRPAEN
jgi:uncharacterized protein (TIGR03435 family)